MSKKYSLLGIIALITIAMSGWGMNALEKYKTVFEKNPALSPIRRNRNRVRYWFKQIIRKAEKGFLKLQWNKNKFTKKENF